MKELQNLSWYMRYHMDTRISHLNNYDLPVVEKMSPIISTIVRIQREQELDEIAKIYEQ